MGVDLKHLRAASSRSGGHGAPVWDDDLAQSLAWDAAESGFNSSSAAVDAFLLDMEFLYRRDAGQNAIHNRHIGVADLLNRHEKFRAMRSAETRDAAADEAARAARESRIAACAPETIPGADSNNGVGVAGFVDLQSLLASELVHLCLTPRFAQRPFRPRG